MVLWSECLCLPCLPNSCWYPNAQYNGTKKWSLWEVLRSWGWTLTNGMSAVLLKEPTHSCLIPSATRGHNEKSETQKRTLTQPHRHPDFRLLASRTLRINFCCLQAIQSVVFCYSSLNRLKHMAKKKKKKTCIWLCIDGIKFSKRKLLELMSFLWNLPPHMWGACQAHCASRATFIKSKKNALELVIWNLYW